MTPYIVRRWPSGAITVLLPSTPGSEWPLCLAYDPVGGHGDADPWLVIRNTAPATAEETVAMRLILAGLGYPAPTPRHRISRGLVELLRQAHRLQKIRPPQKEEATV